MNLNHTFRWLHVGLPDDVLQQKLYGDYEGAIRSINRYLSKDIPESLRCCLIAQREMIARLADDYPLTVEDAVKQGQTMIPDFSAEEFQSLLDAGRVYWIYHQGEKRIFGRWAETLCKTDASFATRAGVRTGADGQDADGRLDTAAAAMRRNGSAAARIRCRCSVQLAPEVFEKGAKVRAVLPLPCACEPQSDIRIESVSPAPAHISPEDAPQRVVLWEETLEELHPFTVEFSYVRTAKYTDLSAPLPATEQPSFYLEEQMPHIRFSPLVRELARELTEGVTEPVEKARRIYDYITKNIRYTFMPAYFELDAIVDRCLRMGYGDCGVLALTFITLCRCAGVPARWESGWKADPDACGAHDWAQFYAAPYGWLYADPSFGCGAVRAGNEQRRQHYFGNLDPYRFSANTAFQADFDVPWDGFRADPYDNQLGEMELNGRGLCYEEYIRTKEVLEFELL